MEDNLSAGNYGNGCGILLGAYWRSSPGYFDDVHISPASDPPPSFTTTHPGETFPSALLNTSLSGGGGTSAINKFYNLALGGLPDIEQSGGMAGIDSVSVNGTPLYLRLRNPPTKLTVDLILPRLDLADADYNTQWDDLKGIVYRQAYCYFLFPTWAAYGFLANHPDLFWGEKHKVVENATFKFKYFYAPTVSSGTKTYTLLR